MIPNILFHLGSFVFFMLSMFIICTFMVAITRTNKDETTRIKEDE
jgi:energy-converting hydrogenase Eha subunit H